MHLFWTRLDRGVASALSALSFLICLVIDGAAWARDGKVALVVGNSAYQHTSALPNPRSDASDIATALAKLGYSVTRGIDLDKAGMEVAVRTFSIALSKAEVGVFFYAGHGLQVSGQNYLVPVDAKLEDDSALDFELIKLDVVQRAMERQARTSIIFLDACRDNPLARNLARSLGTRSSSVGRGLAPAESGVDTLISFSTQPGNVALDGSGRNSPFAGALVKQLLGSHEDIADMLIAVRRDVMAATGNRQVPWEHSALTSNFYFAPSDGRTQKTEELSPAMQAELTLWNSVKDSSKPSVIRSYIDAYPKGIFAPVAKAMIADLEAPRVPEVHSVAAFNGRWSIIRIGQNCPTSRYVFEIRIRDGNVDGDLSIGQQLKGTVTASGELRFSHTGNAGGTLNYSASLKSSSGIGSFSVDKGTCKGTLAAIRQ